MNYLIIASLILLSISESDTCKTKLDLQLGENEVFIQEHPFEKNLSDFESYFCPSVDDLKKAKELLIAQYNYLMETVPGSEKYYTPPEDVKAYLDKWKIQYYAYKTLEGEKRIFMNLIRDTEQNKGILEDWRTDYVYNLSESNEQLMLNFIVSLDKDSVSF